MEMRPRPTTQTSSKTPSIQRLRWPVSENCELQPTRSRSPRDDCRLCHTVLAATNKCLAQSNKSRTGCEATKKRESSVSLQAKRDDKRRASGRSDLPSDDVGLHRRRDGLRRDRVTMTVIYGPVSQRDVRRLVSILFCSPGCQRWAIR